MQAPSKRFAGALKAGNALKAGVALGALAAMTTAASAGGFAVREQSASLMGSAFAGAAAGVDLSSSFWNPAAFGIAANGLSTQSAYTLITADTELSNETLTPQNVPAAGLAGLVNAFGSNTSTDIDEIGIVSASYAAYRINDKLVIGGSVTSPFGLKTDADDYGTLGRLHGVAADMMTVAVNTSVAYEVAPGIQIAAGPTFQYMKLKYWLGGIANPDATSALKLHDDIGFGYTAGILVKQGGTSFGVGYRSKIEHRLRGDQYGLPGGLPPTSRIAAELETPEQVTGSLVQALSDNLRILGTVEWTNWSRIDTIPLITYVGGGSLQFGTLDAEWDDGWFFSGGLEYDYSPVLTLRVGGAYEISPIREAAQRLSVLPDSDRIWATAGATYKYSEATTFDVSYAHVFFEDSHLTRDTLAQSGLILDADVENSANIFSVGMRTKW